MLHRFTVGGIAALVAIVAATMVVAVSPTEAKKAPRCTRTCQWKCDGLGVGNRCVGRWYRVCGEWRCLTTQG